MDDISLLQKIIIYSMPVLLAITVHEAAHAYAAKRFGDATAYMLGRMTLNPLKHIDPVGTILLPLLGLISGGMLFGWAKPVPVNFGALKNPRVGMRWVALAGPLANLAMAIIWGVLLKLSIIVPSVFSEPLSLMSRAGVGLNFSLMLLNMLPILPLDGGRVVESLLPPGTAWKFSRIEPYGLWIVLALAFSGILSAILQPLITLCYMLLNLLLRLI
ncbi:site-2 protease family protein [Paludibacterium paludis]|uniref:Peptidase M50 n=1 Tax=Paludibacterium paludis TaxID=1225769 RepID=A0A918NWQ2_9NEIS|nr:site-2 protease family protein [Paludibacterium paludis]GGY02814.1 peptidase M50 [Paludibacterium paludis]